jgi:ribosomal protein L11 methyltransferase
METADGFKIYMYSDDYDESSLRKIIKRLSPRLGSIRYTKQLLKDKNWNVEWESNFHPVIIDNKCLIKAPFHKVDNIYPFTIQLKPKMAFGTGHHPSTHLMISQMLHLDFSNSKRVLDMGCGTGILAILAHILGAIDIVAIDNNEWAIANADENFKENRVKGVDLRNGDVTLLNNLPPFDLILVNINRIVILADLGHYRSAINMRGRLLVGGILKDDAPVIVKAAEKSGWRVRERKSMGAWSSILFAPVGDNLV